MLSNVYSSVFESDELFSTEESDYLMILEEGYLLTTKDSLFLTLEDFSEMFAYYSSLVDFYPEEVSYVAEELVNDYSHYETVFSGIESFTENVPYQVY